MIREIKFRAWDKWHKRMIASDELIFHEFTDVEDHFKNDELVFQQYTGLKDKIGAEIYEGDIVQYGDLEPREVLMRLGCWYLDRVSELGYLEHFDLFRLGNIYENPELSTGQES